MRDTGRRSESLRTMLFSCSGDGAGVTRVTSCLCSFFLSVELRESKIAGWEGGGRGAGGKKQELLTDNEQSHQGNVLVGFLFFILFFFA